mmetsp:Transcript_762/g.916  ORF Transcript_762/g.916 Transcript_762/m.916 type:complete len:105 (+) Transcript_762:258-572(+)
MFSRTSVAMAKSSNQKIHISLKHMRTAARMDKDRRLRDGICMEETTAILDAFPQNDFRTEPIYDLIKKFDECIERSKKESKKSKSSNLHYLNRYLVRREKFKRK